MESHFPDLIIAHKNWEFRLAESLGKSNITFESAEFSHEFRVSSMDKKFAYHVCHPQMMEYLIANSNLTVEISGKMLALIFETWLKPAEVENNFLRLIQVRKLLPDYLFTDVSIKRPIHPLGL